jgi:hypothetical protein
MYRFLAADFCRTRTEQSPVSRRIVYSREHLVKDIGNLRVVLLKSVLIAQRALVAARFFQRRYWSQITRVLFLLYKMRLHSKIKIWNMRYAVHPAAICISIFVRR